jgi:hypothetical protein
VRRAWSDRDKWLYICELIKLSTQSKGHVVVSMVFRIHTDCCCGFILEQSACWSRRGEMIRLQSVIAVQKPRWLTMQLPQDELQLW